LSRRDRSWKVQVLDHFDHELNEKLGGVDDGTGHKVKVKIALLGGADLVETFSTPGVWLDKDLTHILCDCRDKSILLLDQAKREADW
jgi:nicotinic acid mononucleotide adenylyltransferase